MFEGVICGLIAFAVVYVGVMRVLSRRADVLYGAFIQHGSARQASPPRTLLANILGHLQKSRATARG